MNKNTEIIDTFAYENIAKSNGYSAVCGVDEAGRGPLAGPVFAAAVILNPEKPITSGLDDSKKLSEKKRNLLFDEIREYFGNILTA